MNKLFKSKNENPAASIESRLSEEFKSFLASDRDRLVFAVTEIDKDTADSYRSLISSDWINAETEGRHQYYPFKVLENDEQKDILEQKEYQVLAFVKPNTLGLGVYNQPGLEIITRVKSKAKMPKFVPESNLNYHSINKFFPESNFSDFTKLAVEHESDASELFAGINEAKMSYDAKTNELLDENRLDRINALYKLEQRGGTIADLALKEARDGIALARSYKNN